MTGEFTCPTIHHSSKIWPKLTDPLTEAKLLLDGCDIISVTRAATFGGTS
jgi:hypothetical protein